MIVWAIKHVPSGTYMPTTARNRGFTSLEVDDFAELGKGIPRLFESERAAKMALRCWLKGPWDAVTETEYSDFTYQPVTYTVGGAPPALPPENRKAADMEVVRLELRETT